MIELGPQGADIGRQMVELAGGMFLQVLITGREHLFLNHLHHFHLHFRCFQEKKAPRCPRTLWKLLRQRFGPFSRAVKPPTIANVPHRSVFVPSVNPRNALQESALADIYLQLPVGKWSMMDFKCMDEIVEAGYQSSLEQLKNFWD